MAEKLFAKCGNDCGGCPSFRANLRTDADRERCCAGWLKYFGSRFDPAKLIPCDGCQAPDKENPRRYQNCRVRRCAVVNGVKTCAHCSGYPCEDIPEFTRSPGLRERIAARLGAPIPEEDYLAFVEPCEGMRHLAEIRACLAPDEIVEMKRFSCRPQTADLPAKGKEPYRRLYDIIANFGAADGLPHARWEVHKKRRGQALKLLWAFGRLGEPKGEGLVLTGEAYLAQKIQSNFRALKELCALLGEHGARCEHVPLREKGWLTPTGALRKGGWFLKLSFTDGAGGASTLEALRTYTHRLEEERGRGAFRSFSRAEMGIITKAGR